MSQQESNNGLDKLRKKRIEVFFFATGSSLASIALFAGIGHLIDQQIGTSPKLLIAGLVLSYPFTLYYLVKRLKKNA